MAEHPRAAQLEDWIVNMFTAEAEPNPTREYYLVMLREGHGVPEAVGLAVEDLLEEIRTAVSRGEQYQARAHRARLSLPSYVPFSPHRLPRPALVRRIVQERLGEVRQPGRPGGKRTSRPT